MEPRNLHYRPSPRSIGKRGQHRPLKRLGEFGRAGVEEQGKGIQWSLRKLGEPTVSLVTQGSAQRAEAKRGVKGHRKS